MAWRNKLFAKCGHDCELSSTNEELPMFRTGGNICTQIKNSFLRSTMAADDNINALNYLKSQKRVESERLRQVMHYRFMVHPFSDFRRAWEAFMIFVLIAVFIIIPLDIAAVNFPLKNNMSAYKSWKILRLFCDLLLCCDIIMNFLTGYWDGAKDKVVLEPKKVAIRYCCTFFIPDLLSSLPSHLDVLTKKDKVQVPLMVLNNLSILKIFRIFTFLKYCKSTCESNNFNYIKYRLLLAIFCYLLYIHLLTCFNMVIVGKSRRNLREARVKAGQALWIEDHQRLDFYGAYARVLRSAVYMTTLCFTSRTLAAYLPKYAYVVVWITSKVVNFYIISQFMECAMSSHSSSRKYGEMLRELEEYMRHKQLPVSLQKRLMSYYEFKFQKSYFRESEILNVLSGQLKQDLVMHSCRKLVENVGFFQNLPLPLIVRIVSSLSIEIFMLNDVILKVGSPGICMYFIASGCVAIYTRNGFEVKHLEDGDYFGEYSLMKGENRHSSVVAVETCELYRLEKVDFVRVIMSYPDLMDKITRHAVDRLEMTEFIEARFERNKKRILKKT